jgi:hypothetical protein
MNRSTTMVMTGLVIAIPLEILGVTGLSVGVMGSRLESTFAAVGRPDRDPPAGARVGSPPRRSEAGSRVGRPHRAPPAGARGVCQDTKEPWVVFLPALSTTESDKVLTSNYSPSFYLYIPDKAEDIHQPVLRLSEVLDVQPEDGVIAPTKIAVPKLPGLLKVQLPKLEKGKNYRWALSLRCKKGSGNTNLGGIISYQELTPQVLGKLAQSNSGKEKAAIYGQENRWLDAVAVLMEDGQLQTKSVDEMLAEIGLPVLSEPSIPQASPVPEKSGQ